MKKRILLLIVIYASLTLLFVLAKPIFIICNDDVYGRFALSDILPAITHGFSMDLSMAGYLTVVPALMIIASVFTSRSWPARVISVWRYVAVAMIVMTVMADSVLYSYWHFKLDTTPVFYFITSPGSAMASTAWRVPVVALIAAAIATALTGKLLGLIWSAFPLTSCTGRVNKAVCATVMILLTGLLFIPIRGGVTVSTMNPSAAYFSNVQELNHAAVNPMFSLLYSATHQNRFDKEFRYYPAEEKESILAKWRPSGEASDSTLTRLLDNPRPDIYIIILESFSSELMPMLGGEPIAMRLDSIARRGITFTNFYGSSFRTDRAIPAVLSGYPAQPSTSIMKFVEKTDRLPSISRTLRDSLGYRTAYYYGGDINFVNQKAYLKSSGFETVICDQDFPLSKRLSKWGAHDDLVFDRMWDDIKSDDSDRPVMRVLQTSSSHEPFEVPYEAPQFSDERQVAFAFADHCLGEFMDNFAESPRWQNALVIIVPDHWGVYPRGLSDPVRRHRIPMVITGGAVESHAPATMDMPASQSDIAATLLAQMGVDTSDFPQSHNMLDSRQKQFAFFSEPDFAGVVTPGDTTIISTHDNSILRGGDPASVELARAFLQNLYDDLSKR